VAVAYSRNKLSLLTRLRNLNLNSLGKKISESVKVKI